jgi:hypothetical protein
MERSDHEAIRPSRLATEWNAVTMRQCQRATLALPLFISHSQDFFVFEIS